jgi:hypothetical protein
MGLDGNQKKRVKVSVGSKKNKKPITESILSPKILVPVGIGLFLLMALPIVFFMSRRISVCKVDGKPAYEVLDDLDTRWSDARTLASSTSRMSLPSQIKDLQGIKQEAESIDWSNCSESAANLLINSMDATIEGFIEFLDPDTPEYIIQENFETSQRVHPSFAMSINAQR